MFRWVESRSRELATSPLLPAFRSNGEGGGLSSRPTPHERAKRAWATASCNLRVRAFGRSVQGRHAHAVAPAGGISHGGRPPHRIVRWRYRGHPWRTQVVRVLRG